MGEIMLEMKRNDAMNEVAEGKSVVGNDVDGY